MKHCQTLSSTIPNLTYFNIAKLIRPLDNFYFPHPNLKKKKKKHHRQQESPQFVVPWIIDNLPVESI